MKIAKLLVEWDKYSEHPGFGEVVSKSFIYDVAELSTIKELVNDEKKMNYITGFGWYLDTSTWYINCDIHSAISEYKGFLKNLFDYEQEIREQKLNRIWT